MKNHIWIAGLLLVTAILACTSATATTATPSVPVAYPKSEPVNCRVGPGTTWDVSGALLVNQTAVIQGRNADSSWWYVQSPTNPAASCWVAASATNTSGNLAGVAVVADPVASVTSVGVEVNPQNITLPGCLGPVQPVEITGSISVNGPLSVQYRFETEQGGQMATQTIDFEEFGTQTINIDFTPTPEEGDFWIRLVIITPGGQSTETEYHIDCT